jgi:hypothetical protein
MTAGKLVPEMKQLRKGITKRAIAKQLGVSRLLFWRNGPSNYRPAV